MDRDLRYCFSLSSLSPLWQILFFLRGEQKSVRISVNLCPVQLVIDLFSVPSGPSVSNPGTSYTGRLLVALALDTPAQG